MYWILETTEHPIGDFLIWLLASEVEIQGYDLKGELRHIYAYLGRSSEPIEVDQIGMVF